jgi:integrase/recombinase XerD
LIGAHTDAELVKTYLNRGGLSEKNICNTGKELQRFLFWCTARNQRLADIQTEDLIAYSVFLADPQPAEQWVSATKWPREHPNWRPFTGPLSTTSHRQAMIAVRSLFKWATQAQYIPANPAALLGKMKTPHQDRVTRYLSKDATELVFTAIDDLETKTPTARMRKARDRFLIRAYYTTGARLSELVSANMGAIYQEDERWWLDVVGKGDKPRRLPVIAEMRQAYQDYRVAFGLLPRTVRDDRTPLVLGSRGGMLRATEGAVSNAIKGVLQLAAATAEERGDEDVAAQLRKASAHWLRHSVFTHLANSGVSLKTVQATAGHAKLSTTGLYLHKDDHDRFNEIASALERSK